MTAADLIQTIRTSQGNIKLRVPEDDVSTLPSLLMDEEVIRELKLHNVTTLDLSGNKLGKLSAAELAAMLHALKDTNVTTINLSYCNLEGFSADELATVLSALKGTNVTTINLTGNKLGHFDADKQARVLDGLKDTKVTAINLSGCMLTSRILGVFKNTNVTEVNLSKNEFGGESDAALAAGLASLKDTKITVLDLSENFHKDPYYKKECISALATLLGALKGTTITRVDLSKNSFCRIFPTHDREFENNMSQTLATIPDIHVSGMSGDVFDAHNLLMATKKKLINGDFFLTGVTLEPIYGDNFAIRRGTSKNTPELLMSLQTQGGALGCLVAGAVVANIINVESSELLPTNKHYATVKRAIDLFLQSTTNPHLVDIARHQLAELKMKAQDIYGNNIVGNDVANLLDLVAKHMKTGFLGVAEFKDAFTEVANFGFYFIQDNYQADASDIIRQNQDKIKDFLNAHDFTGSDLNNFNREMINPMMKAIELHDYESCLRMYYFGEGVNLDITAPQSRDTLLHYALMHYDNKNQNSKEIIRWLIEMGADLDIKNSSGKTPADLAQDMNCSYLLSSAFTLPSDVQKSLTNTA